MVMGLSPPELHRLFVVLKPLKLVAVPELVLVPKPGLVENHVEVLRLVVELDLVLLGFSVVLETVVILGIAEELDPFVAPEPAVELSLETSGSPVTQLNIPMNGSSLNKSASCPPLAPALR